jgi:hypothetical protein
MRSLFFLIFIFLSGCVNLELKTKDLPEICLSSFFTNDSSFVVKITPLNIFSEIDTDSLVVDSVVLTNITTLEKFLLFESDDDYTHFVTQDAKLQKGNKLQIKLFANGNLSAITAIDSIPFSTPYFEVLNQEIVIEQISESEKYLQNSIGIKFPNFSDIGGFGYYELELFTNENIQYSENLPFKKLNAIQSSSKSITSEDYYPSSTSIGKEYPSTLLFKVDHRIDSMMINFKYNVSILGSFEGMKSFEHDLKINLKRVTYSYYQYFTSFYRQKNAIKGDMIYGSLPPVIVPGNIENGVGVFAGYTMSSQIIHVNEYFEKY